MKTKLPKIMEMPHQENQVQTTYTHKIVIKIIAYMKIIHLHMKMKTFLTMEIHLL